MTYQDDVKLFMRVGGQPFPEKLTTHTVPGLDVFQEVYGGGPTDMEYHSRLAAESAKRFNASYPGEAALSVQLLTEELHETVKAIMERDIEEIADGLVDITYIVMGIANRYGIDFDAVWSEVHSANLSKFPDGKAELDANGKIVKPANWVPPNIARALGIE